MGLNTFSGFFEPRGVVSMTNVEPARRGLSFGKVSAPCAAAMPRFEMSAGPNGFLGWVGGCHLSSVQFILKTPMGDFCPSSVPRGRSPKKMRGSQGWTNNSGGHVARFFQSVFPN